MNKKKNRLIKRLLAAFLSVVLVMTGMQLGDTRQETAEAATEATITAFNKDALPVTTFHWEYDEKFTKAKVCPNGAGTSINSDLIEYGGLTTIGSTAGLTTESKTLAFNINSMIKNDLITQQSAVQSAADISVVSGLPYSSSSASKPWVKYKNVGYVEENGEKIQLDLKVTITGWEIISGTNQKYAFVEIGVCVDPDAAKNSNYPHDAEAIGIWPSTNVKYVNLEYTFYKAGTSTEYSLDGQFSMVDLDGGQYFKIQNTATSLLGGTSNISKVTQSANDYLVRDGYDKKAHTTLSTSGTITTVSSSSALTNPNNYVMIGSYKEKVPLSYEAGYVTFSFEDQSTVRFRFGNNSAADGNTMNVGHYYYGITPFSIGSYAAPTPTKQVLKNGSTLSYDNLTDSTTLKSGERKVTYVSSVVVPRSIDSTCNYKYFCFTDTLNSVFDYDFSNPGNDNLTVQVYQDSLSGTNVTSWFADQSDGSTLKLNAYTNTINENGRDFFGHTYYFVITTEIKSGLDKDDFEAADVSAGTDGLYSIPNTCSVTAGVYYPKKGEYKDETNSSETVYVCYTQPTLTLTKQVKLYGADDSTYASSATVAVSGDKVHYKVVLENTTTGSTATNVSFTDKVPSNVTVDTSTLKARVYDSTYTNYYCYITTTKSDQGQITMSGRTIKVGFDTAHTYTTSGAAGTNLLKGDRVVILEYDATVGATGENGAVNTATATADNDLSVTASATVINGKDKSWSPSVALTKTVRSYATTKSNIVVPNGKVAYYVTATNDGDETLGTMEITDDTLPDSFTLSSVSVYYSATGEVTESDTATSTRYGWTKMTSGEDGFTVSQNGNAWTVSVDDSAGGIPVGAKIRVYASYTVGDDVTSGEVYTNTAQVTGTGIYSGLEADAEASAAVTVKEPKLQVTKTSDKSSYTLGETAHYTIEITQTGDSDVYANVASVYDLFDADTSETLDPLYKEDSEGNLTGAIQNLTVTDGLGSDEFYPSKISGDTVKEELEDEGDDVDVEIEDTQSGYYVGINESFGVTNTYILITYDVELTNEALVKAVNEPGTVTNTVIVTSDNVDAVYAQNTIEVASTDTQLSINKQVRAAGSDDAYADAADLLEGQDAEYLLTITNIGDQTAENVTINDAFTMNADNTVTPDSYDDLSVTVYSDEGYELGSADPDGEKEDCFTSGDHAWSLDDYYDLPAGYSLTVTYTASYTKSSCMYFNAAQAEADNAANADTSANVYVEPKTSVTVNKVWDDSNNQDKLRPDNVTVRLYKNETATDQTVTLSEDNSWTATFEDLHAKEDYGQTTNVYTVQEETTLTGYTAGVTKNSDTSYTITNSYTPRRTTINVVKKILAEDINFANGDPIFVINLTGTDNYGGTVSKHEVVQFTEAYVAANTDSEGYVSITAVFDNLLPGDYNVTEDTALRYRLKSINGVEGVTGYAFLDTSTYKSEEYTVLFENEKYEWQYLTETDHVVNSFNTSAE